MSGALPRAWDQGGSRPDWAALNVDHSLELLGPQDRRSVTGATIIRSRVLPRRSFVAGMSWPLTIRLRVQSLSVSVEPSNADRITPIVAAVQAQLDALVHISDRLRSDLKRKGRTLDVADAWIAATALMRGCPLASDDRDFLGIPGLALIQPI